MPTIHFHRSTVSTPEQFIAGLTDFGPGRSELLPTAVLGTIGKGVLRKAFVHSVKPIETRSDAEIRR
ncbi:hypothetical protein [Mycobacterium sp. AZCC_0083]|uniref:hypothetical protein n=1 Tax=Mycobacterium sp. AZCC_0083 TaxID=2735882 RepID=UPI001621D04B|nr:hypothetical protein [Mycobacterium sp. AZCC_0083]MBB5167517.1 hypothetical protein [Mycobacterium sp. AZCC_0083]